MGVEAFDPVTQGFGISTTAMGCPGQVPVRLQHQECSRDQWPGIRPMTLCDEHLRVKMYG